MFKNKADLESLIDLPHPEFKPKEMVPKFEIDPNVPKTFINTP